MKTTKINLQNRVRQLEIENHNMFIALQDISLGRVKYFGRGEARIGICRPTAASGPVVITHNCYVAAYCWELWFDDLRHITPYDDVGFRLRDSAFEANTYILNAQPATAAV